MGTSAADGSDALPARVLHVDVEVERVQAVVDAAFGADGWVPRVRRGDATVYETGSAGSAGGTPSAATEVSTATLPTRLGRTQHHGFATASLEPDSDGTTLTLALPVGPDLADAFERVIVWIEHHLAQTGATVATLRLGSATDLPSTSIGNPAAFERFLAEDADGS